MATAATIPQPLTTNQQRGCLAAWGGWALDGMDSFIYAQVLVPALTECRASAIGFIRSVGRFVGVALVFVLGSGIAAYGSLGVPVAVEAGVFVFGLILLPFSIGTTGQPLPA